ncbi:MAG TPA: SHOCT domain-containing protein [Nitrosopumilaceae archaeon]|nr:SHOCT domain-containing protein [Nitrosopumilaceae archaeon]
MAAKKKKTGYLSNFLKRADKAIDDAISQGVKRADEVLDDAVEFGKIASAEAQKQSKKLHKQATKESEKLKKESEKRIRGSIASARKMSINSEENLKTLEKLGKLRKSGVITEKEFQAKKKKLLARI